MWLPLTVILPMNVLLGSEGPLLHAVPGPRLQRPSPPSPYSPSSSQPCCALEGGKLAFTFCFLFPESKSPRPHSSVLEDGEGS